MRILMMLIPYAGLALLAIMAPEPSSGGIKGPHGQQAAPEDAGPAPGL